MAENSGSNGNEGEIKFESDPEESKLSLKARWREASDDEDDGDEEGKQRREDSVRPTRRIDVSDGESEGAVAEYDGASGEDVDYAELGEEEEQYGEDEYGEEYFEGGGGGGVGRDDDVADEEGRNKVVAEGEDGNLHDGGEERKEAAVEPFSVPTAGAFYMHGDRFRDNAVGGGGQGPRRYQSSYKNEDDAPITRNKHGLNMFPRWKGKAAKEKALANPMSITVSSLGSSLIESNAKGLLSGSIVLLTVNTEQSELLNKACFGRPIITKPTDYPWFQLSLEEGFYMFHMMKCLIIVDEKDRIKNEEELWDYMTRKNQYFPLMFKGYSHLRSKNWVVRQGSQFGVDFVAYSHHPSLVHSEYAVLVLKDEDDGNDRLRVWSDFHCTLRLCGSVAKTLLVLHVRGSKGVAGNNMISFSNFADFTVEERLVKRWDPKQGREDQSDISSEKSH